MDGDAGRDTRRASPDLSSPPASDPPDEPFPESPDLGAATPQSSRLSRNPSYSGSDDWDPLPPADRLSVLDLLDNFALPQQLEKLQKGISAQTDKVRRSKDAFRSKTQLARDRMVEEWRRRAPSADEQLDRYKKRMRRRVDKLGRQWNDTKAVSMREKISFIFGVFNIFISGYLIGAFPEYFHIWYTGQLVYFMPIRFFTYRHQGYHYFLADLCYFANLLLTLSIWGFPASKRLFMAAYCLSFGNNAVAIIMWRNSLVFHSLDKVTSLFIHIMPCATLHCIVHLLSPEQQRTRFPAIWTIKNSTPGSPTAYANVVSMLAWSTIPYAFWQIAYYLLITVRRRDKIAAGRPTSFTWLRRSYSRTWVGSLVLSLPARLQESAFMAIQYGYAVLTMLPCPVWFASRYASSAFLFTLFAWSIYNGSTYYIDVFGKRFQKELEAMKTEVFRWQNTPELKLQSPEGLEAHASPGQSWASSAAAGTEQATNNDAPMRGPEEAIHRGIDHVPLDDDSPLAATTGADGQARSVIRERNVCGGVAS